MIMIQTIKARAITLASEKARADGHAEGHAQARAKYQSWFNRQREAGTLSYDESDPPSD